MTATLHEPLMPARPPRGRRIKLGPARVVFLLVLLAAGLGVLARLVWAVGRGETGAEGVVASLAPRPSSFAPRPSSFAPHPSSLAPRPSSASLKEILAHPDIIPTHNHPLVGRSAPDFELADPEGKIWNLGDLRNGRPLVLIFYHGYRCPSCVRQLFEVNRDLPLFREVDAQVVAISADPPELTRERLEQNGSFGFTVLADPGHKVAQAYRVFQRAQDGNRADLLRHGTFVIDRDGTVAWVNVGDAPLRRNPALLCQLARMNGH